MVDGSAFTMIVANVSGFAIPLWLVLVTSFLAGVTLGSLITGRSANAELSAAERVRAKARQIEVEGATATGSGSQLSGELSLADDAQSNDAIASEPDKLKDLEVELSNARDLLSREEEIASALRKEISSLDAALNRANGRLKLIINAMKRAVDAS
ncbi:MAG: hypothetical protein AAFR03_16045 [Pseudomonadota bacterium]